MTANPLHLGTGAPTDPNLPFAFYLDLSSGLFWQKVSGAWIEGTLTLAALGLGNGATLAGGSGAPTGETPGGPGSIYVDVTGFNLYMNTGTLESPVWTVKSS